MQNSCSSNKFLGRLLFLTYYLMTFAQIYSIYLMKEPVGSNSYLIYFKSLFYALNILVIISHLQSSFTDPGKIKHSNNVTYIEFYCKMRALAVKRAEIINNNLRHLIRPQNPIYEDNDDEDLSDCENDDYIYEKSNEITENFIQELNKSNGLNFELCKKCHVARAPGSHHCSICEG